MRHACWSTGRWFLVILGGLVLAGLARPVLAYDQYSDGTANVNCAVCHEAAPGGFQSRGPLHDAHLANATNTCLACHETKAGDIPFTWRSGDTVLNMGCSGCHGAAPGGVGSAAGLRLHHQNKGVTVCTDCHNDSTPPAESVNPVYYGQATVIPTSACNADGKEDFWNHLTGLPDGKGLDNDGDLLIDAADGDCATVTCHDNDQDGYGNPGDPSCPRGSKTDCDDAHADTYPGAIEAYDLRDNNCNTEIDEIESDGFFTTTNKNRYSWSAQPPASPSQLYDILRSDGPQFPTASANTVCLVVATSLTQIDDTLNPPAGRAFYYLVRNTLVTDYGKKTDGTLRLYTTCP
jgi:hypothetical protein